MERLRNTLIAAALTSVSPAFADETSEGGDPFEDIALGEDKPSYDDIVRGSKPVGELGEAELKRAFSKGMVYTYNWSGDKDINPDFMVADNIGYRFGGKGSRELSLFFRADKVEVDNSGEQTRILYEVPNDNSDQCYQATHFAKVKLMNSKEGEKTVIVLVNPGKDFSDATVGEQGCDVVLKRIKEKVQDSVESESFDPDRLIPSNVSANIGANAGNFFPYTDPLSGQFEPFAFNERTGISAEIALDWKPFGDKSVVSIGPDATLVLGVDGTGTATRVGGHLGFEVDKFRFALNGGLRGDSTYAPLDGIPYVGAELDAEVVNLGENLSVEAFLQAKKDFPGNPGVIDPSLAAGARLKFELPDFKASTIAKAAKTEKPLKEPKVPKPVPVPTPVQVPESFPVLNIQIEQVIARKLPVIEARANVSAAAEAEHVRISEDIKKLKQRNLWPAVEASYQSLIVLQKKEGISLSFKDLKGGAEAARALGDMEECYVRLLAAKNLNPDDKELSDWLVEIEANFGEVSITLTNKNSKFENPQGFFDLSQRLAYVKAVEALSKDGKFEGFLPVGEYLIDGKVFKVESLPTKITISVD